MEVQKNVERALQWHPAFYAGIRIELEDDADNLIFENEHQLGTKPFGIDVLIVKKESEKLIQKNIGKIFRKYNIIEYKSPTDYMSIDDFYKVYGYSCFYKTDVKSVDHIKIEELTISLVCKNYPRNLVKHLQSERGYPVNKVSDGIYYVMGDKIPIQVIVTKELSKKENLWLRSLTDQLKETEDAEELIREYKKNKDNNLYQSVMNIIVQANREKFQEAKTMCEALKELMKDELDAERNEGKEIGKEIGKDRVNELNMKLANAGRVDDIVRAAGDKEYQNRLFKEFGM